VVAGEDLGTTQRYMHLSPVALDAAIRLLEVGHSRFSAARSPAASASFFTRVHRLI